MSDFTEKIKTWVSIDNQISTLRDQMRELRSEKNDLKEEISKSKKWVRTLKANRSPIIMDKKYSMLDEEYKEIGYSEINKRYKLIEKHREELSHKLRIIDEEKFKDKLDFDQENKLAEEKIYTLNIKNEERNH